MTATEAPKGPEGSPTSREEAAVRFWGAIYAYIRQAGRRDDEARELTQGFIADVLLGRDLLAHLDERRGRFRTLLLSAVRNYLADAYRFDHAARRHPGHGRLLGAGDAAAEGMPDAGSPDPEAAYNRAWIRMLVEGAAAALRAECADGGREAWWDVFESRVLRPALEGAEPVPYEQLMARWNLDTPSKVSNAVVGMRRAFARHLVRLLGDPEAVGADGGRAELRELLSLLEGRNQ